MLFAGKVPTVLSAENGMAIVPIQHPIILFLQVSRLVTEYTTAVVRACKVPFSV